MWAQSWINIASLVMPFPDMPDFDVTDSMQQNVSDARHCGSGVACLATLEESILGFFSTLIGYFDIYIGVVS